MRDIFKHPQSGKAARFFGWLAIIIGADRLIFGQEGVAKIRLWRALDGHGVDRFAVGRW